MNAQTKIEAPSLDKLREPFPPNQISKLPKETRAQIDARKADKSLMVWKCPECGGPHHKNAVHLDYVGHAALTDRLLDTDPAWFWEPLSLGSDGLPALDANKGLWIKLTVLGVTRLGYGSADGKTGGDAIKEIIGDALRNAAMRFGAALDLWHKGDLHLEDDSASSGGSERDNSEARQVSPTGPANRPQGAINGAQLSKLKIMLDALKLTEVEWLKAFGCPAGAQLFQLPESKFRAAVEDLEERMAQVAKQQSNAKANGPIDIEEDLIPY